MIHPTSQSLRACALGLITCLFLTTSLDAGPFGRRSSTTRYLPTRQVLTTRPL